ncbi:MAG: phycobiliprotein lyase [Coleofasciculaceae cyanobacterium]
MDAKEFFEQCAGKWFSQRTSHYLDFRPAKSGKSDIFVETLSTDNAEVIKLCQKHDIRPEVALLGLRYRWEGTMEGDKNKHIGSTLIVPVPNLEKPNQGLLLQERGNSGKNPLVGQYILGEDGALTMITENENLYSEERIWFASPNLKLRSGLIKRFGRSTQASISSEIRMGLTQPPQKTEDTAVSN